MVGLTVSDIPERCYSIAGIYRDFDESLGDTLPEAVDTRQYKSYSVAQAWRCYYYNDKLIYEMEKMNVLELDVWATGTVSYSNGFYLYENKCNSHYIGFSPKNYDIAKIYDADIEYTLHKVIATYQNDGSHSTYDVVDVIPKKDTLKNYPNETSYGGNSGGGLFGRKYTWKRIQTVEEFLKEVEEDSNSHFDSVDKEALKNAQFVFRFCETDLNSKQVWGSTSVTYYVVDSISIVRMYFLTQNGRYYNLGVVHDLVGTDNKAEAEVTTGDNILNAFEELSEKLSKWFEKLILIIGIILIVVFLNPIIKIFEFIINSVLSIVRIITKPIRNLLNRRRN